MPRITLDAVATAMDGLYETTSNSARLPRVPNLLRRLFQSSKACLVRQGPDLHPTDAVSTGSDIAFARQYRDEFSQEPNVRVAKADAVPGGGVYRDHERVGRERLRASRIWNGWMRPQDMHGGPACKLMAVGDSCWLFDVQRGRGQPDFDDNKAAALRWLKPALTHVAGLRSRIGAPKPRGSTAFVSPPPARISSASSRRPASASRASSPRSCAACNCRSGISPAKACRLRQMDDDRGTRRPVACAPEAYRGLHVPEAASVRREAY